MQTTSFLVPVRKPRFLTAEVAHACGVPVPIFKSWLLKSRGILALTRQERPVCRKGLAISFSWNRLVQTALMEALNRLCWLPTVAAKAALIFSDVGGDNTDIPGCLGPDVPSRQPAHPFETGRTILAVRFPGGDDFEPVTEVHNIRDDERFGDVWRRLTDGADGISLVDCVAVLERVKGRLAIYE